MVKQEETSKSGAAEKSAQNKKKNQTSGFQMFVNVCKSILLILLILIAMSFLLEKYCGDKKVVVLENKEAPASEVSSVTLEITPKAPEEPKVTVKVEEESFTKHSVILNKDNRLPVEWRKLNFAVKDPRNKAVYYLAWKTGKGVGPASVRVLDWDRLPTSPDAALLLRFADPNMIEDLGFRSKTERSAGKGVPVLVTE